MTFSEHSSTASRWLLMMLALILLGVMHIVLPSTGGSGADLPEPLLVWCVLLVAMVGCAWILRHQTLRSSPFLRGMALAAILLTLPLLWSPSVDWRLDAFPRLAGLWAGVAFYYLLLNCRLTPRQQQIVLWLIVAATLIQAVYALVGIGYPAWLPLPAQAAQRQAGQFAIGVFLQRNVTGSFLATGAAVLLWLTADGRFTCRSLTMEKYRQWGSALGSAALRHTDVAEVPYRMAGRHRLLADDGVDVLFLAVTPLRRARGSLACRTGRRWPACCWGLPCSRSRYSTPCMNTTVRTLSGFLFCSRPGK